MNKALIIFAKLPVAGEVKTRMGKSLGMERAAAVYEALAGRAFAIAEELASNGMSVYLFFSPSSDEAKVRDWVARRFLYRKQEGGTLGERMQNAFDRTFRDGAQQAVIIGTDIPELLPGHIRSAFDGLAVHDVVIGPCSDGGYYILGMHAPTKELFGGIEWSSTSVFAETMKKIRHCRLACHVMEELSDIDTEADYNAYLNRTAGP